jgi:hypothetical protein
MAEETKKKPGGNENSGKQPYQRLKPYIIYDYLMHNSDEAHTIKVSRGKKGKLDEDTSIQTYLDTFEISAERRSVYKDIDEMNQMLLIFGSDHPFICELSEFSVLWFIWHIIQEKLFLEF